MFEMSFYAGLVLRELKLRGLRWSIRAHNVEKRGFCFFIIPDWPLEFSAESYFLWVRDRVGVRNIRVIYIFNVEQFLPRRG